MMKRKAPFTRYKKKNPQSGNIFFMLFASIALIGAMTVGAGNVVKGIVTSMSEVTRKTVAEEKMQGGARISIQAANSCDSDDFTEPLPFRDAGAASHPAGGGFLPDDIGATTKDPWGTEYGYCAWDFGSEDCADSPNRLKGGSDPSQTVVAVISAGKDRKFSTTCNPTNFAPADCSGLGAGHYNDPVTGHCYYVSSDYKGYNDAQSICAGDDAYLLTITSSDEQALIEANVQEAGESYWLGVNDLYQDGAWRYAYGELAGLQFWQGEAAGSGGVPVSGRYSNWHPSEPNGGTGENCGVLEPGGLWNDLDCAPLLKYICEKHPGMGTSAISRAAGSDDIVMEYTYNDANGLGGDDLWRIVDTKPGTAKIDKNIDVAGGAELSGPLNLMKSGLILPDDSATGACDGSTDQQIRINFSLNPPALEICDYAGGNDWTAVSMGGSGGGGAPAFALVQTSGARSSSGDWTNPYVFSTAPVIGNTITVQTVNWASGTPQGIASVTDNYGNTYTKDNEAVGGEVRVTNWSAHVETTGANFEVTVEFASWNTETSVTFSEWTGLLNPAYDVSANNTSSIDTGDTNYSVGPTPTLSQPSELALSVFGATTGNANSGITAPAGYTLLGAEQDSPAYIGAGFAYKTVGDTLPLSATWSFAPTQWIHAASIITTYKLEENADGNGAGLPSLPPGYVGFWRFDEGAGATAVDSSGNNITGTVVGATWTTGKNGSALSFDGDPYSATPNSVELGNPAALNIEDDITIGAWLNLQSAGIGESFLYSSYNMTEGLVFDLMADGSVIYTSDNVAQVGPLEFGKWSFVTMTIDSGSIKYYLNGNLIGTGSGTLLKAGSPMNAYIGANGELAPLAPHGVIDDFIIYDRALNAEEVGQLYQSLGGEPVDPSANGEDFLLDSRIKQCRSAGKGPFVEVAESDITAEYDSLFNADSYLYSAGYSSGVSAFARNGDGTLTKITTRSISAGNTAYDVYADSSFVYVANGSNGLTALTFNGTSFTESATIQPAGTVTSVAAYGSRVYITNGNNLTAYNFNGSTFTQLGQYSSSGANDVWTDGQYLYLSSGSNGLIILTFSGTTFTEVAKISSTSNTKESIGDGSYLYINDNEVMRVFSFDGILPVERGRYSRDPVYMSPRSTLGALYTDSSNIYMAWEGMDGSSLDVARLQGDRITTVASYKFEENDFATGIISDGGYIYAATESGPIKSYSGFACFAGSNNPAGVAMSGFNSAFGKIGVGYDSSCAIKPDGSVWCWGIDATVSTTSSVPVRVPGSTTFTQIATATDAGVCGLDVEGNAWCWGRNDYGQLGNGNATGTVSAPYKIPGNRKWSMISAGRRSYCAIENTGDMYCWGEDDAGNLGTGGTGSLSSPTLVAGGIKWSYVAASPYATCGIDTKGQLWCWGENYEDALGTASTDTSVREPVLVKDPGPWSRVSLGAVRICAVKNDGSMWCWGNNEWGIGGSGNAEYQDGLNTIFTQPIRIADSGPWKEVSVGRSYGTVCGIKQDGTAWCWGSNAYGQAGAYAGDDSSKPAKISDPGPWAAISTGATTCAMKVDGSAWCWGYNSNGQLGDGTTNTSDNPVAVANFPGQTPWVWNDGGLSISATGTSNIAIGSSSTIGYRSPGPRLDCSGLSSTFYNDPVNGHCYFLNTTSPMNWDNAQTECGKYGGYLATITNQSEQNRFMAAFGTATSFWIGASDAASEGDWIYTGGELAGNEFWNGTQTGNPQNDLYNNWVSGSDPNGGSSTINCAATTTNGYWMDTDCTVSRNYVCEIGTAYARGGLSFPSSTQTTLYQYTTGRQQTIEMDDGNLIQVQENTGNQLTIKATAADSSVQLSWKTFAAATSRSMGIDHTNSAFEIANNTSAVDGWMHDLNPRIFINTDGNVAIGSPSGTLYNKLTINGGLRVGNDTTNCHIMRAGALRFVGGTKPYEYCNGTSWVTF